MPSTNPNNPQTVAVEHLETLGLSAYAARTFVALVSLGEGTAREVSNVS
jgi:sugar-specific transcriptional regulator TrmB